MRMLVCIIGRHGTGKTTIGKALERLGMRHISVGEIKRASRRNVFPDGIPHKLLGMLSVQPSNTLISMASAWELVRFLLTVPRCSVDGFPPAAEYIELLPPDTFIIYCITPKLLRERRLSQRSEETGRKWNPGGISARDAELARLTRAVRGRFRFMPVRNDGRQIGSVVEQIKSLLNVQTDGITEIWLSPDNHMVANHDNTPDPQRKAMQVSLRIPSL